MVVPVLQTIEGTHLNVSVRKALSEDFAKQVGIKNFTYRGQQKCVTHYYYNDSNNNDNNNKFCYYCNYFYHHHCHHCCAV